MRDQRLVAATAPSRLLRRTFLEGTLLMAGSAALTRLGSPRLLARDQPALVAADHPLDPLSPAELEQAVQILRAERKLGDQFRFISAMLEEPAKAVVVDHVPGQPFPRQAFVVLLDRAAGAGYEAIVDLNANNVVRFTPLPAGVQPSISNDEFVECELAIRKSPDFLAAVKKRGVNDPSLVMVDAWSAGHYGNEPPDEQGRRLARALCFVRSEADDNGYARPLDMVVVVDLNRMEVVRIADSGVTNLPPESANWARKFNPQVRQDLKPLAIVQPDGPSFSVDGYLVRWQKWKFRIGFTPREGLVLHTLSYDDDGRQRPILHRASICEMVVPYGDPGEDYYRKNAFDIGEYLLGTSANSLAEGCDCLGTIRYFDAHYIDSRGKAVTIQNAVCLHEEDVDLLWKHTDWRTGQSEARRSRRLSVSTIATAGNYEYGFFWHLYQDGTLQ
jgi:primary-amine oxidase